MSPIADKLGIRDILRKYPYEVSGGQKQENGGGKSADHRASADSRRRADRRAGLQRGRRTSAPFGEINAEGQTILMVTHSTKAASHARRVLFIKDGEVFHQIYKANMTNDEMFAKISDTLTILATGGGKIE